VKSPVDSASDLKVAIVEDDPRYRSSIETLLSHTGGFRLAASSGAAGEMLEAAGRAAASETPVGWDLVMMDLDLPGMNGVEATRRFKKIFPHVPIVVVTVFEEPATILDAICAGADGYLLKKTRAAQMLDQLRAVAAGGAPLTSGVARTLLDMIRDGAIGEGARTLRTQDPSSRVDLTERERDVLRCLVAGLSYKQVAAELGISIDTVRAHIRSVYRKLQVHNVAEAVSRAIRDRLT